MKSISIEIFRSIESPSKEEEHDSQRDLFPSCGRTLQEELEAEKKKNRTLEMRLLEAKETIQKITKSAITKKIILLKMIQNLQETVEM